MCQAFLPIMRKNGRIVNVSSAGSSLSNYSPDIQERFRNPHKSLQDIETLVQEYEVGDRSIWGFFLVSSATKLYQCLRIIHLSLV